MKRYLVILASQLALASVYFAAGKFGLSLAFLNPSATTVWPPSGIALAALLLWGNHLWPGIFIGAVLVNSTTQGNLLTTLAIATGNTLEAVLGAWLVNRWANGIHALERAGSLFLFLFLATVLSTAVSATCGVTSLSLGGFSAWEQYKTVWLTWWLGDLVGELIFTPFLVIWLTQGWTSVAPERRWEALALAAVTLALSCLIFLSDSRSGIEYLILPPLLWAAFRFGAHGALTLAFIISVVALLGTTQALGPFTMSDRNQSLFLLQSFIAALTITALVLAAVLFERNRAQCEIGALNEQLAADLTAMTRLQQLSTRPVRTDDLNAQLSEMLEVALTITGHETGIVQLFDSQTGVRKTVARIGFATVMAEYFNTLPEVLLSGRATMRSDERLVVDDLPADTAFTPKLARQIFEESGIRSLQSTPLIARSGRVVGLLSTFSHTPHRPSEAQLRLLDILVRQSTVLIGRTRAYGLLRESEQRLRAVVETAVDGIITFDENGVIKSVNPAAEKVFDCPALEMLGKNVDFLIPGLDRNHSVGSLADASGSGEHKLVGIARELEGRRKNGTTFPLDIAVSETHTNAHSLFTGIFRDITERKRAEAALQQAKAELSRTNEVLEQRVQARTQELQQSNAALLKTMAEENKLEEQLHQAQKLESIGTLAGGIAHNFNNLLNIIKGYAGLLAMDSADQKQLADGLRIIDETVDRGAATVQQLMAIARKSEVKFERADLNILLGKLQELLRGILSGTIEIEVRTEAKSVPVWADPNQLDQVLLNICINARDAMPNGGTLHLSTATLPGTELRERFHDATDGSYACIAIADTGTGMSDAVKSRIFEPFYTTKELGEGTGLGLSVAYGIITNHKGFIDVASTRARGTTFRVYLPLAEASYSAVDPALVASKTMAASPEKNRLVLFVEDEVLQLEIMRKTLENQGYRVLGATDGIEAVELYSRFKDEISVVVLDIGLPKLNGWDALQKMREIKPTLKPIIASGNISPTIESAMARGELSALLRKPYRPDEIVEKIALA